MGTPATLKIAIIADAAKAVAGLNSVSTATGKAEKSAEKTTSKWKTMASTGAKLAGAAALGGVVALFKTGVSEQSDFLAGQAQLANGIKTTGGAANVTVGHLENLASSIQNYSGQTDDSVVASEKLLLTFTNIQNKGKGANAVFDEATKLTADMAAKMGGDASKYAVQLGKALNDPAKGMTALTRIGVSFTEGQKKQIKALQAAGDTMGAQKVILAELRKEFGGSAKAAGQTLPGQLARAKRSFEDVAQSVVAALLPVLTQLADFLTGTVMPIFAKVMGFIERNKTVFTILATVIGTVWAAWKIWNGILIIWDAILAANPIGLIIIGLVALGAALVVAYKKCATFRKIVQAAFTVVKTYVKILVAYWVLQFKLVRAAVELLWKAVKAAAGFIKNIFNGLVSFVRGLPGRISSALSTVFAAITSPFKKAWDWIQKHVIDPLRNAFNGFASAISKALSGVYDAITQPFIKAANFIHTWIIDPITKAFNGILNTFKTVWNGIAGVINSIHISLKVPSFVPGIGGKGWEWSPHLPTFAAGAVVNQPTLAVVGEAGREFVTPEPMLRRLIREELGQAGIHITVNGALDPDRVARQIEDLLEQRRRRVGGIARRGTALTTGVAG